MSNSITTNVSNQDPTDKIDVLCISPYTSWRSKLLSWSEKKQLSVTIVDDKLSPEEIKTLADRSRYIICYVTAQARNIYLMQIAEELMLLGFKVILIVEDMYDPTFIDNQEVTGLELKELNMARLFTRQVANISQTPVFDSLQAALGSYYLWDQERNHVWRIEKNINLSLGVYANQLGLHMLLWMAYLALTGFEVHITIQSLVEDTEVDGSIMTNLRLKEFQSARNFILGLIHRRSLRVLMG